MTRRISKSKRGVDPDKLTEKELIFCQALLTSEDWNLADAVRKAYPKQKNPSVYAQKLLNRDRVQKYLGKLKKEREERTEIKSDEVWQYLHEILFLDILTIFEPMPDGWWRLRGLNEIPYYARILIEEVNIDRDRLITGEGEDVVLKEKIKVKLVSKTRALAIAAHHALPVPTQNVNVTQRKQWDWDALCGRNRPRPKREDDPIEKRIAAAGQN